MIRKFLKRCFLAVVLITMFVFGAVATCFFLASSPPSYYAEVLNEKVDQSDMEAAIEEMEQIVSSMELFVMLDATDLEKLRAMPEQVITTTKWGRRNAKVSLADAIQKLEDSQGENPDTFTISLSERLLNACLSRELDVKSGELRRPYVLLQEDGIRFAVTLDTPTGDFVLSSSFYLSKKKPAKLSFELQGLSIGRLPIPANIILKQLMRTNPDLPQGIELEVDGECPTFSISTMLEKSKLHIDSLQVMDGILHLTFRRPEESVIAANN